MTHKNLTIEDNVPIPKASAERKRTAIWWRMKPGQSVFFAGGKQNNISGGLTTFRQLGFRFTTRKVDGGVRVWVLEVPEGNGND